MSLVAFPQPDQAASDAPSGFEDLPAVMSPRVLAAVLDVTPRTLERWRVDKIGPAWMSLPGFEPDPVRPRRRRGMAGCGAGRGDAVSVWRFLAAATVVIVAVLLVPAALVPGVNSADLLVFAAPFVLVWICARPARRQPPGPTP